MIKLNFHEKLFDVSLEEPKLLKAKLKETDQEYQYFALNRESFVKLYKDLHIKYNQSKAIFDADQNYWQEFLAKAIEENNFSFDNYHYITAGDIMLSIENKEVELEPLISSYNKLTEELSNVDESKIKQIFDLDTYMEKIIIKTKTVNTEEGNHLYDDVVILQHDYINSKYFLISGIYINKLLWLHSAKSISVGTLTELFSKINLADEINLSTKFGEAIYKDYKYDATFLPTTNLSLNELFLILKHAGINFGIEKDKNEPEFGNVINLTGISEGSIIGDKILNSLNSFDMPIKPLMRLQSLKKSFKDSKISFEEILILFTMEYFNIQINITIDSLISLKKLFTKHSNDSTIIKNEISELNK